MPINRREVLTASLASAAAVELSADDAPSAEADSPSERQHTDASPALVSLYDYEVAAKRILSGPAWEYFNGGSADEITLRRNRQALDVLQLKSKVLVDVTSIDRLRGDRGWSQLRHTAIQRSRATTTCDLRKGLVGIYGNLDMEIYR